MRNLILTLMIWIICFTAMTIGVTMTYDWYRKRGVDIYLTFNDVHGLVPNESKIIYRGVQIGNISDIYIDVKTGNPTLKARITKSMTSMIGKNTQFWIVRPELGVGSVNNLSTIVTGSYVAINPIAGEFTNEFRGLDQEPIEMDFDCGLTLTLRSTSAGGINNGSAILYRDFQIGEVEHMDLSTDRNRVLITACINSKYVDVVRKTSYFANISGFHASIHLFGTSEIGMDSLKTLVKGGITLITPNLKASPAQNGDVFNLLTNEQWQEMQNN